MLGYILIQTATQRYLCEHVSFFSCNKQVGRCNKGECWSDEDCDVNHACETQKPNINKCIRTKGCIER